MWFTYFAIVEDDSACVGCQLVKAVVGKVFRAGVAVRSAETCG